MEAARAARSTAAQRILCQQCPVFLWTLTLGLGAPPVSPDSAPGHLHVRLMYHQHHPCCLSPLILGGSPLLVMRGLGPQALQPLGKQVPTQTPSPWPPGHHG